MYVYLVYSMLMHSLEWPGVPKAVGFEVFRPHRGSGLEHLHEHHVTHHTKQTCERQRQRRHIKLDSPKIWWKLSKYWNITVPPKTVKMAAKALRSWPQHCVEGDQVLIHNCTDSSMQLINSRPIYMISSDSDSHIIAGEGGEEEGHNDSMRSWRGTMKV